MKNLIIIILTLFIYSAKAQVVGNNKVETKAHALENVVGINIQMYAKVTIDMDSEPGIFITGESNIIDLIQRNVENGILLLDQKEWIEPTKDIEIQIGAPRLQELVMGTHDKTIVTNINGKIFTIEAPVGEVVLSGSVEQLIVQSMKGSVDASSLICESADVIITSDGAVKVNVSKRVNCAIDEDGRFENVNESATLIDCIDEGNDLVVNNVENRYINLQIKNNSWQRNHFVVVGPKPNGRKFSYGFPLMPLQSKKERWTIGTKIYKENSMGIRKLLVTLTEEDEDQMVKLFN